MNEIHSVKSRAFSALSVGRFSDKNLIDRVGEFSAKCPFDRQYILRMICRVAHEEFKIPSELEWLRGLLEMSDSYQRNVIGVSHPFCYITVRHGLVTSETDDEWHTDGFSTKITHLPEQNYIVSDCYGTEYAEKGIDLPGDFDPLIHNLHKYIGRRVNKEDIKTCEAGIIYCMDPYNIHRRQGIPSDVIRTFIRISYVPIEIMDDANTENPLLPVRRYNRDGVKIRNELLDYDLVKEKTNVSGL